MTKWAIARMKEPSSWAGIAVIAYLLGTGQINDPPTISAALAALVAIVLGEKK